MSNTDDKDYEPQPGPSWRDSSWRPEDHVNDIGISFQRVKATKRLLKKDKLLRASLSALFASRVDYIDAHNWLLLVIAAADHWKHPSDHPTQSHDPLGPPPRHALYRAAHMLIGPRGMVHGWTDRVPDFDSIIGATVRGTRLAWPARWTAHSSSDGDSSFRSDSPGHASDMDAWSGPRGVVPGCLTVTGDTTDSDTSSYLSDDPNQSSRLDVNAGCEFIPGSTVSRLKQFDRYVEAWHRERRERRAVRRTRRWVRENVFADHPRATDHPSFVVPMRRAERLAARYNHAYIEQRRRQAGKRKKSSNRRRSKHDHRDYSSTNVVNIYADQLSSQQQVRRYVKELRDQVADTWRRFYDYDLLEEPRTNLEPDSKNNDSAPKLECWITPVRWIQQQGPK